MAMTHSRHVHDVRGEHARSQLAGIAITPGVIAAARWTTLRVAVIPSFCESAGAMGVVNLFVVRTPVVLAITDGGVTIALTGNCRLPRSHW
ncbi:MAG: hypothetical protein ACLVAV_12780 [Clostridium sp.]